MAQHDLATTTFASAPTSDRYLQSDGTGLGAEGGWFRTFSIGSNWTEIRFGMQYAIVPDSTNNLTSALLTVSINTGSAAVYPRQASVTNSYYAIWISVGPTLTYNAGAGNPYFSNTTPFVGRRQGVTDNDQASPATTLYHPTNTGSTQRRGILYIDFSKITGQTVMWYFTTAGHVQVDYSESVFLAELATQATPAPGGNAMVANPNSNNLVTDTGGALDTIGWYFGASALGQIQVYNVAAYRFI